MRDLLCSRLDAACQSLTFGLMLGIDCLIMDCKYGVARSIQEDINYRADRMGRNALYLPYNRPHESLRFLRKIHARRHEFHRRWWHENVRKIH